MTKADYALTTSITPTPTSRNVLSTPAVVLSTAACQSANGIPSEPTLSTTFSAEYRAYLAARTAVEACGAEDSTEWCDADFDAHEQRLGLLLEKSWTAAKLVIERAPTSWDEVWEVANIVFREQWDHRTWERHSDCEQLEVSLFRAIFAMKPISEIT